MSYYNTTGETGLQLKESRKSASKGDQRVLDILKNNMNRDMSPSLIQYEMALTSDKSIKRPFKFKELSYDAFLMLKRLLGSPDNIKRSLNTLYNDGLIERQESKVKGAWGKEEFTYRIKK